MEKQRRRDVRGIVGKIAAVVFAAGFVLSIVPAIRALAEGTIFKIQSAEITEISTGATGSINTYDEQTIVSNVTFHKINDSISYKIVLQNSDNKDHIIESITDDNASESIDYIYDAHAGETVTAGANLDFLLTAKYAKAAADTSKRAEISNVKFFIKFIGEEEPEEIDIVVPNTGKNTAEFSGANISLITMIISAIGLTILTIIAVKKHKKYAKIIGAIVIAASTFGLVTSARAVNVETNSFTLTTNYGLYDKLVIKNGDNNVIINYGDKLEDVGEITNPEKPGYIFSGWQDEDDNDIDPTDPIYKDLTIKPKFTAISYKVRFNANGGAGEMADQTFTYDEAANLTTNTFTYTGRAYAGWDTEANGSGVHYDDAQSVKNLTTVDNGVVNLYAQWSINPYYINYNANGGEGEMATTNCEYDEDCQLRANAFTKYGYDFAGWKYGDQTFTDGQIVRNLIEQGTITLEAQWTPTEYEIHYDGITDEERFALNNPTTYTIETPAFQLHNPADRKDNDGDTVQVFVGWQETTTYPIIVLPNTNNLGAKTYLAIWNNVPFPRYNITYDLNNGNVTTANPTTHDKTESFTLNEPTKTGYTFTGWTGTTIEGSTPVMNYTLPAPHIRDAIEFTAHYRKNTYTINFDGNGSTSGSTASMNMNYDEAANLIANGFERTGYTFAGWKYNNEDYADGAEVTNLTAEDGGAVTMAAQWEPTQYTIIFHANNENVENPDAMAAQIVTYDIETPLTANAYTWWQHKIVEWTTNENGTGTKYADKAVIKNLDANGGEIHLYAKWREIDAALDGCGSMTNKGINTKLKAITTANPDAKNFLHYPNGEPSDEIKASATDLSGTIDPIYAWVDGENIYWWSEDVKPRISTNNSVEYHYYGVGKSTAEGNVNNLEYMDLTGFDTTGIVGARSPFEYTNIRRVDISDWDLSNATDMSYFAYASKLEDIIFPEHFDVQKVTSLNMAFAGAKLKKLDLRGWKTRDLRALTNFIQSMPTITEVTFGGDFKTDNVTSMASMINANANLATINNINTLNTAKVTSMRGMFDSDTAITSLDLSAFDTTALTDMAGMFKNMSGLTSLTLKGSFTAANVTNMEATFYGVKNINTIDLSNLVSKPTNLKQTFAFTGGGAIETIDISNMDLSDVTTVEWTFFNANSGLKTIYTSSSVNPEVATNNTSTFQYDTGLVGGANTHTYEVGGISSGAGSRIDDPDNGKPGYFTYKNARYIRYHDNDGDDTNDETNYTLMPSHYIATGSENPYNLATKLAENNFERSGFKFMGWAKTADGEVVYADGATISEEASKTPLEFYAVWVEAISTLQTGGSVNVILKSINADATAFAHYTAGTPDFDAITDEQIISTDDSVVPTYAWNDNGTIYWWSETDKVYVNESGDEMFRDLSSIESIDLEGLNFSNNVTLNRMFAFDSSLKEIKNINALNTPNVTSISHMFYDCNSLESLNLSGWDTSNIENVEHVFTGTTNLSTLYLDEWNLTNFNSNLVLPTNLTTISMKNAVAAEDMTRFFADQANLTSIDLTNFNTSNTKTMAGMFNGCTSLESLNVSSFDTSNVENMNGMFGYLSSLQTLDVSNFNTSNVKNMYGMFAHMDSLQSLNVAGFNTEKVENMNRMFSFSYALNELDISSFDTSSVSDMESMFHYSNVKQIYASEDFDTANTTSYAHIFNGMTTGLKGGQGTQWNASIEGNKNYATIDDPDNGKPGLFSLKGARYIRYHDNDGDDTNNETNYALMTSHYLTNTGSLKVNAFTNGNKTFTGWNTAADGSGDSYTDGQAMTELTESKTPLELYAQWEEIRGVLYHANGQGVEGSMSIQDASAGDSVELKSTNFSRAGYGFAGWNTEPDGTGVTYGPNQTIVMPEGPTFDLYALWVAPEQDVTMQTFDASAEPYASAAIGTVKALRDIRDDNVYTVAKLADGKWWMTENLRLDLSTHGDKINSSNTHNPLDSFVTEASVKPESAPFGSAACSPQPDCLNTIRFVDKHITRADDNMVYGNGVFYNWHVATAGHGANMTIEGTSTEGDICSKGWHLPTGKNTTTGEYYALARAIYNSDTPPTDDDSKYTEAPNNFLHSGWGSDVSNLQYGYYWTSTFRRLTATIGNAYDFTFAKGYASYTSAPGRGALLSVRCVAD